MPGLTTQLAAFGLMAGVLLVHAGLTYGLHHHRREPGALPYMGYLLATCGAGLAYATNVILVQVASPDHSGLSVILISSLLELPFHGLAPFFLLLFAFAHLGRRMDWKLKLGYWIGFGAFILYNVVQRMGWLLYPDPARTSIGAAITAEASRIAVLLTLAIWGYGVYRMTDPRARAWSAILASTLAVGCLLEIILSKLGFQHLGIQVPALTQPLDRSQLVLTPLEPGTGWKPLIYSAVLFWGPLPAFWVLRKCAALPKPETVPPQPMNPGDLIERFGLTPREAEVAAQVMEGRSNKEICDLLFISMDTVKRHVTNVYKKTGAKNRVQLSRLMPAPPSSDTRDGER